MLINREKIAQKVQSGEIASTEDLSLVLRGMIKEVVETAMGAELTAFLGYEKHRSPGSDMGNRRNGYSQKELSSKLGSIVIDVPRDREAEFTPAIVKKRQKHLDGFEDLILSMYSKGMSTRDIQYHVKEIYNYEISPETVSRITDAVIDKAREWQTRPLEPIYAIIFMDAIFLKLRVDGRVKNVAAYLMIGIDLEGKKECLGIWLGQSESAKYWLSVLNELRNRGVNDVLIFAVDGLSGFPQAIHSVYPDADIQRCIVHQIRNSLSQMAWKDRKAVADALRSIYTAPTEEAGLMALQSLEEEWGKKYPQVILSWYRNWAELSTFFRYPAEVRRLIYTTNPIESLNSRVRKTVKGKSVFPTETSLFKTLYLAVHEAEKRWTVRTKHWPEIMAQLSVYFQEKLENYYR